MFKLINNTAYNVNNWSTIKSSIDINNYINDQGVSNAAHRVTQIDSGANWRIQVSSLFAGVDVTSKSISMCITVGKATNASDIHIDITDNGVSKSYGGADIDVDSLGFSRFNLTIIPSSIGISGFNARLIVEDSGDLSVARTFDFADFVITVDSLNSIEIDPNYDYEEAHEKIENRHRVRSGEEYVYKWGEFKKFSMGVSYVNSGFKSIVNSYWNSNAELIFVQSGSTEVYSVHITNSSLPVGAVIPPYTDLFSGVIELETY